MASEIDPQQLWQGAILCHQRGDLANAVRLYSALLDIAPDSAAVLANRGAARLVLGELAPALADLDRALALDPTDANSLTNRGAALYRLGRREEALACLDRALEIDPDAAAAYGNRGAIHFALGKREELLMEVAQDRQAAAERTLPPFRRALQDFSHAAGLDPANADHLLNRAHVLAALSRRDEALEDYRLASRLAPANLAALLGQSSMLWQTARAAEALPVVETATRLDPNSAAVWNELAIVLKELARVEESIAACDRALACDPDYVLAVANKAVSQRMLGQFDEGLRAMESRKILSDRYGFHQGPQPEWTGTEDVAGRTVLVQVEQGLGDTIQFCRYLPMLMARGARVVLQCQPSLIPLISTLDPRLELIAKPALPQRFDYHVALMSLPLAFGTLVETIPAQVPYLKAEPDRVAHWRERLGENGFKVGLSWHASLAGMAGGRSIPLVRFEPLRRIPGVRLISLQKGHGAGEVDQISAGRWLELPGDDFDAGPGAFLDTAAMMQSLDLVISVDTSIVHLAGALARPVWTILPWVSEWRWLMERPDTPWYPTMRLFRRAPGEDWERVLGEVEAALAVEAG